MLVILGYIALEYFALGLGLTNHILRNMVGSVFHHLQSVGEGKNTIV